MKRVICLCLAAVLLLGLAGCAKKDALLERSQGLYATDAANVLSDSTENYIVSRVNEVKSACGGEIAVVTVDGTGSLSCGDYAYQLFNDWGVGDKSKNNGFLVLMDKSSTYCYLTVGYGIESDFPQTKVQELTQQLYNYMALGNYDKGARTITDELIAWYAEYYHLS